ncbi:MAG TPA: protein kinase [Bryobacteraceae bacterium]|nr:protein kinase [Bryobacteraceae bacterium]
MGWLKPRPEREYTREHALAPVITLERRTLAQRLQERIVPLGEALRIGMEVAQALRNLHDEERVHGALSPQSIELTPSGIELVSARTPRGVPTPYSAPEVLTGQPPDARSDIFSFGAVLFEMIEGRWPFEGDTPESLAVALQRDPTPPTGNPAVDSLLSHCLAKDPAARCQRMQKLQVELRLICVTARRTDSPVRRDHFDAAVRSEIQSALESQVEPRFQSQETSVVRLQQCVATSAERLNRVEQSIAVAERLSDAFAANTAAQLHALEQTIRAQAAALEAARTALAQTDDLVERIVEALDSLQTTVLERSDFISGSVTAYPSRAVRPISG